MKGSAPVLITGATGFVGSALTRKLLAQGHTDVRVLTPNVENAMAKYGVHPHVRCFGNGQASVEEALDGVDTFFNFAVVYDRPHIEQALIDEVNVDMPLRVMKHLAAQRAGARCVLGDTFFRKFAAAQSHQRRYTVSKQRLLDQVNAIADDGRLQIAFLQIEHVYGPGEAFTKAIPQLTKQIVENVPRVALTSGRQCRDFIYVDDVASAAIVTGRADHGSAVKVVECGSGTEASIHDVMSQIHAIASSQSVLGFGDIPGGMEVPGSRADTSWLTAQGWAPETNLSTGLQSLVQDIITRTSDAQTP